MNNQVKDIEKFAAEIRLQIMEQLTHLGFGHLGGSMSITDLLAVLYSGVMNVDPSDPKKEDRDRLIISKGHAGPALYATLALRGFFPMEWLMTLNEGGTKLPSHCDRSKTPGIDFTTGSLGQGLSPAAGMAYAFRLDKKDNDVYVIVGDGELQEGQNWEAIMTAAKYQMSNLYCFVDRNKYQVDGAVDDIMPLYDVEAKLRSFGRFTQSVDGHDIASLLAAITIAKTVKDRPCAIIMDTVKGKGYYEFEEMAGATHHMKVPKDMGERAIAYFKQQIAQF